MLVKLTPDQVADYWDVLRPAIEISLPPVADPTSTQRMNHILSELLSDNMHCWAVYRDGGIWAVATMYIQQDAATKCKDLLLYSVYAMAGTTTKDWVDAFETVRRWGLAHGCKRIVGYTNNPSIMRVLQNFETEIWTYVMVNFVHQMDKEEE